jgi:hypothetical protein
MAGSVPVTSKTISPGTHINKNVETSLSDNDLQASVDSVYITQSAIALLNGNTHLIITV